MDMVSCGCLLRGGLLLLLLLLLLVMVAVLLLPPPPPPLPLPLGFRPGLGLGMGLGLPRGLWPLGLALELGLALRPGLQREGALGLGVPGCAAWGCPVRGGSGLWCGAGAGGRASPGPTPGGLCVSHGGGGGGGGAGGSSAEAGRRKGGLRQRAWQGPGFGGWLGVGGFGLASGVGLWAFGGGSGVGRRHGLAWGRGPGSGLRPDHRVGLG